MTRNLVELSPYFIGAHNLRNICGITTIVEGICNSKLL